MSRFRPFVWLFVTVVLAGVAPSHAQVPTADTSKRIVVKTPKSTETKPETFLGEVIFSTSESVTVRSRDNERLIRTFRYAGGIHDDMQKILDRGGYQYGDKIEIKHDTGSDIALRIKGKPSKPL
jgi:hypothetical protein